MTLAAQWYDRAHCRNTGMDPDDFFPTSSGYAQRDRLTEACRACPVWQQCRIAGLGEPIGFWGGVTKMERSYIRYAATPGIRSETLQSHAATALRSHSWDAAFATLKRLGWDATHRSLHEFHYLPKLRKHDFLGFGYRDPVVAAAQAGERSE